MKNTLNSFVVANPNKCIGCKACELACATVHSESNNVGYTVGTMETPVISRLYLVKDDDFCMPIQCRHCEDAPCANTCPVGAITQDKSGISVNEKACIGCKTCLLACPFGAIDLLPLYENGQEVSQINLDTKMIAYKCDLCKGKKSQACIDACPEKALSIITPQKDKKAKSKQAALSLLEMNRNK